MALEGYGIMKYRLLGAMMCACASNTAMAQSAGSSTATAAPTEPTLDSSEIIVTAQKRAERLQDVPISITAQSAAQLQSAGVQTTKDLTKVVPGLVFAQNEAFSQPAIRGVTSSITVAGAENPIAIYLDGVYQPSVTAALYDLPDVDHIEVLKGPQGTLFGRNATGGAIQIFTKAPSYTTTGKFTLQDGYYTGGSAHHANEVSVNGFISGPIVDDTLAYSVSGFYRYNPGYMTNDVNGNRAGLQRTYGTRAKLLWEPSSKVKFVLSGYYNKAHDEAAYSRAPLNGVTSGATFGDAVIPTQPWHIAVDPNQPNIMRLKSYGISLRGDFKTSIGTFTTITGYSNAKNPNFVNSSGVYSPNCQLAFTCLSYRLTSNSRSISQEFDYTSEKFGIFSVTAGLFYYHNFGNTQDVDVLSGADASILAFGYRDSVKTDAYAAFAEMNADFTDHLHVIVGGRYNRERLRADASFVPSLQVPVPAPISVFVPGRKDSGFTPRVSIRYSFDRSSNVYFTYSKGFRSGTLPQPFDPNLTPVAPEKLDSYEVGFKTAQSLFTVNAAFFYYKYKNLQLTKYIGALSTPQNAASSTIYGADVDGSIKLTPDLQLTMGFNFTPHAKFDDYQNAPLFFPPAGGGFGLPVSILDGDASGLRIMRIPKFSGSVGANWQHQYEFGKLGFDANLYHSSSYKWDVIGSVKTRRYQDLSGQFYVETDGMRISIFGKNLLNKAAINGSQPSDTVFPVLYIPPRQIGVSLGYSF